MTTRSYSLCLGPLASSGTFANVAASSVPSSSVSLFCTSVPISPPLSSAKSGWKLSPKPIIYCLTFPVPTSLSVCSSHSSLEPTHSSFFHSPIPDSKPVVRLMTTGLFSLSSLSLVPINWFHDCHFRNHYKGIADELTPRCKRLRTIHWWSCSWRLWSWTCLPTHYVYSLSKLRPRLYFDFFYSPDCCKRMNSSWSGYPLPMWMTTSLKYCYCLIKVISDAAC